MQGCWNFSYYWRTTDRWDSDCCWRRIDLSLSRCWRITGLMRWRLQNCWNFNCWWWGCWDLFISEHRNSSESCSDFQCLPILKKTIAEMLMPITRILKRMTTRLRDLVEMTIAVGEIRIPHPRLTPTFASLSASSLRFLRMWKTLKSVNVLEICFIRWMIWFRARFLRFVFAFRVPKMSRESPKTFNLLIPWSLAIWHPFHKANASAVLFEQMPKPQLYLILMVPSLVLRIPPAPALPGLFFEAPSKCRLSIAWLILHSWNSGMVSLICQPGWCWGLQFLLELGRLPPIQFISLCRWSFFCLSLICQLSVAFSL